MSGFGQLQGQSGSFIPGSGNFMVSPDEFNSIMDGGGSTRLRFQRVGEASLTPEGLSFGLAENGGIGGGYFAGNETTTGSITTSWDSSIVVSTGEDIIYGSASLSGSRIHDLGDGHELSFSGEVGLNTEDGAYAQGLAERSWERPDDLVGAPLDYGDVGFQSWSIGAGALGSAEGLTGAVIGEVNYGNEMLQGFGRAAIGYGEDGFDQSAEFGIRRDLSDLGSGALLQNSYIEAGMRAGDTPIHSNSTGGQGAFIGIGAKFEF